MKRELFFDMISADIDILKENRYAIFFADMDLGACSATNDAEAICRLLGGESKRLVYRDTTGAWAEMRHDRGRFLGFKPIPDQEWSELWNL